MTKVAVTKEEMLEQALEAQRIEALLSEKAQALFALRSQVRGISRELQNLNRFGSQVFAHHEAVLELLEEDAEQTSDHVYNLADRFQRVGRRTAHRALLAAEKAGVTREEWEAATKATETKAAEKEKVE